MIGDAKGLTRFKKGWSTCTRTAYLCGRIFDRKRYMALASDGGSVHNYVPSYGHGNP